jgi:response regulator RpfG family c-di-GMP phosphodiesterase
MIKLLLVEDEPVSRLHLAQFLTDEGYKVIPLATGEEALKLMATESFDGVISDSNLGPRVTGFDVLKRFESVNPRGVKLLITGYLKEHLPEQPVSVVYVSKPIKLDDVLLKLKSALSEIAADELQG